MEVAARTAIAAVATAFGCGAAEPAPRSVVRDSAGVTIVESGPPAAAAGWRLDPVPAIDLGPRGDSAAYEFQYIAGAVATTDGGLLVANGDPPEIRWFGPDGGLRGTLGRRGGGPGEFEGIASFIRLGGDTVAVFDFSNARLSWFTPAGFVESRRLAARGEGIPPMPIARFPNGEWLLWAEGSPMFDSKAGVKRDTFRLYRGAATLDRIVDTVATGLGAETFVLVSGEGEHLMAIRMAVPFSVAAYRALTRSALVVLAESDRPEYQLVDFAGRLVRVVRWTEAAQPVTPDDVTAMKAAELERARDDAGRKRVEAKYSNVPIPAARPLFENLTVGADGSVWLTRFRARSTDSTRFLVFDPAGQAVGEAVTGPRFRLMEVGLGHLLGVYRDEDDVERVRRVRLER